MEDSAKRTFQMILRRAFEKTRRETGLFDAFAEADLLLVRMPPLPSIRAHGTVVNGRKMVIYDTQMFVEKVRGAVPPWRIHCPKSLENA